MTPRPTDRLVPRLLIALTALVGAALVSACARPLSPSQAFRFHAAIRHGELAVRFTAAPGYHLYRDRIHLVLRPRSAALARYRLPPGRWLNDPALGRLRVYEGRTRFAIPFARIRHGQHVRVIARYQGCANAGICYPSAQRTVPLVWTGATRIPKARTTAWTQAHDPSSPPWATLLVFLVAGIGLAFTPCIFPMVPILSATIVGQQGPTRRARPFTLSAAYVGGMALTYTAAGIVAALTGHYVQAAFQNPWVITIFSAVFLVLAASLFGLYELQVPCAIQERMSRFGRGGQALGSFVLGMCSALIVGPCVAAPLAGALLLISRTGDVAFGGAALFALSLGMGIPLLVIGTSAGHLLPKAGPWLTKTRALFGVLLVGVAIWLESRVLPQPLTLGLWGLLAIVSSVAAGALEPLAAGASGWARGAKGALVALLAYGLALGAGALGGAGSLAAPLAPYTGGRAPASRTLAFTPVTNVTRLAAVLHHAHGRPVLVDFWASWCVQCRRMTAQTFQSARVRSALKGFVLVRADVTRSGAQSRALERRLGVFGPPTLVFFNRAGHRVRDVAGYEGPGRLVRTLRALALTGHPVPAARSTTRTGRPT